MISYFDIKKALNVTKQRYTALENLVRNVSEELLFREVSTRDQLMLATILADLNFDSDYTINTELRSKLFKNDRGNVWELIATLAKIKCLNLYFFQKLATLSDSFHHRLNVILRILHSQNKNDETYLCSILDKLILLSGADIDKVKSTLMILHGEGWFSLVTRPNLAIILERVDLTHAVAVVLSELKETITYFNPYGLQSQYHLDLLMSCNNLDELHGLRRIFAKLRYTDQYGNTKYSSLVTPSIFILAFNNIRYAKGIATVIENFHFRNCNEDTLKALIEIGKNNTTNFNHINNILKYMYMNEKVQPLLHFKGDYMLLEEICKLLTHKHSESSFICDHLLAHPETHSSLLNLLSSAKPQTSTIDLKYESLILIRTHITIFSNERLIGTLKQASLLGDVESDILNGICMNLDEMYAGGADSETIINTLCDMVPKHVYDTTLLDNQSDSGNVIIISDDILEKLSPDMRRYINEINKRPKNLTPSSVLYFLNTDHKFLCSILRDVMNVSCRLGNQYYDLMSLLMLPVDAQGRRRDPATSDLFELIQIDPARDLMHEIEAAVLAKVTQKKYYNGLTPTLFNLMLMQELPFFNEHEQAIRP